MKQVLKSLAISKPKMVQSPIWDPCELEVWLNCNPPSNITFLRHPDGVQLFYYWPQAVEYMI